jgi:transglutaminase-like putative cysteine protease
MTRSFGRVAASLLFAAIASFSLWRIFDRPTVGVWASMVTIAAGLIMAIFVRAKRPARFAIAFGLVLVASILMSLGSGGSLGDGVLSPVRGIRQLLESRWPVPPGGASIALVGMLAATSGVLTVLARGTRLAGPAALAPGTVVVASAALLGAASGAPTVPYIAALVATGAATLAFASPTRVLAMSRVTVGVIAVLTLIPLAFGLWLESNRFEPRDRQITQVNRLDDGVSPLTLADELRAEVPARTLFTTTGHPVPRWRLASLDHFDGRVWAPAAAAQRAQGRLVRRSQSSKLGARSTEVAMVDLGSNFIPTPAGSVTELSLKSQTNNDLSTFVSDRFLAAPTKYKVSGTDQADPSGLDPLAKATPVERPPLVGYQISKPVRELAERITAGVGSDGARATALADYLRTRYERDDEAPAGHSAALLETFLLNTKRGREEQFVGSYGLLATAVGLPVRLVVGFESPTSDTTITTAMAHAWPEVPFDGAGWTRMNPTPPQAGPPPGGVGEGGGSRTVDQAPPKVTPPPPEPPVTDPEVTDPPPRPVVTARSLSILMLVGVPLIWLAVVVVSKRKRRRRRIAGEPREQIIGAFDEVADIMLDRGVAVPLSATDRELVRVGARDDEERTLLSPLASLSTEAVYSNHTFDDEQAQSAVTILRNFESGERQLKVSYLRSTFTAKSLRRGRSRWRLGRGFFGRR